MQEYLISRETGEETLTEIDNLTLQQLSQIYSDNCAYWLKLRTEDKSLKQLKKQKSAYFFKKLFETNMEIQRQNYYKGRNR